LPKDCTETAKYKITVKEQKGCVT